MKIVSIIEMSRRIEKRFPDQPFEIIQYSGVTKPVTIKCLNCGEIKTYATCRSLLLISDKND